MNPIRKLREQAGLTQSRLAELGSTSQPTIAAYEAGDKSVTLRTLERLASVSGLELDIHFVSPMTREERRSLVLHSVIAKKLVKHPKDVMVQANRVLAKMIRKHPAAAPLLREWRHLLALPMDRLVEALTDHRLHYRELRHVTPFAGILNAKERAEVYRSFEKGFMGVGK